MARKEFDPRIAEATQGDTISAKDLLVELEYALRFRELPSTVIADYFADAIQKILTHKEDANRAFNLIERQSRPEVSADKALVIVHAVLEWMKKGFSKSKACEKLYTEGRCADSSNTEELESLSAKRYREIFDEWFPRFYPARAKEAQQKKKRTSSTSSKSQKPQS